MEYTVRLVTILSQQEPECGDSGRQVVFDAG